jgi:KaiC/GvpD/RAD55 family RecA-like ATPase
MLYKRLTNGLNDRGQLIPADKDPFEYIETTEKDYYLSTYKYNEEQKKSFEETGTIAGITEVFTDKLWWDFDSEVEPESAKKDAVQLVERLIQKNIDRKDIFITFSGNKGFGVEINLEQSLSPKEARNLAFELAKDLQTFDVKMYNASRILRVYATKHPKTGLYKTPLTYNQLKELSLDNIMKLAKSLPEMNEEFRWDKVKLPTDLYTKKDIVETPKKEIALINHDIDFTKKVKGWSNCKWALLQGYGVKSGDRHEQLLCIIATSKALNYTKEQAYYNAKNADEQGVARYNGPKALKEDIWRMVESVYDETTWKGGTFSCKDGKTPWLTNLCQSLGANKCKHDEEKVFSELPELANIFNRFATDIEKNKIKTGIEELDKNVMMVTSTMIGLLGNPGSGKTSLSLQILNNCSLSEIPCVFFSMDMGIPLVYLKLIQKHFKEKLTSDQVFEIYKSDKQKAEEINNIINQNYNNVKFSFKSGLNVEEIRESIIKYQETSGKKVKLVVVDYLECIAGPYSDANANTAIIANKLKDLANETETCILLLLQTQKHSGAPDEPLLSMKNIKGSSVIEQACSVILTVWREGYNPNYSNMDKFLSIATVKDRFNSLWKYDFAWNGLRGHISELDDFAQDELEKLRAQKKADKAGKTTEWYE